MNNALQLKTLGALVAGLAFCGSSSFAAETGNTKTTKDSTLPAVEETATKEAPAYVATKTSVAKVE